MQQILRAAMRAGYGLCAVFYASACMLNDTPDFAGATAKSTQPSAADDSCEIGGPCAALAAAKQAGSDVPAEVGADKPPSDNSAAAAAVPTAPGAPEPPAIATAPAPAAADPAPSVEPPAAMSGDGAAPPAAAMPPTAPAAAANEPAAPADMPGMPTPPVDPTDAEIETCYELRAHGRPMPRDTSGYKLPPGETYTSFIFKAPWTQPVQGLRFRHLQDNAAVLHHWILYTENAPTADADIQSCALNGLLGFLCGQGSTRSMVTGWAPGRGDFRLPEGVGLELPKPGATLALEMHYANYGPAQMTVQDRSGVEVCVTSKFRPHTASISWLGTESIRVAGNARATASGTCRPRREGLSNSSEPIHILYSWPHMHRLGRHLTSVVNRTSGVQETLYDGDFTFEYQTVHETPLLLAPGDSITTTCSYENGTPASVGFGQSTAEEMCFNFVYAWPAHALDNPNGSIGEAGNTCLH